MQTSVSKDLWGEIYVVCFYCTLSKSAVTASKLNLSATGKISGTSVVSVATSNVIVQSITMTIPANCTKVLILGEARINTSGSTAQDMTLTVDYNSGTAVTKNSVVTATATFNGGTVPIIDMLTVTPGSATFKLLASATNASAGDRNILIIPAGS